MQNNRVSKKVVVPDFKKVDKRKKNVGQHDSDSDFEDEIFVPKIKKLKKNHKNARVTMSKVSVVIGKVDDNKSDKKKSRNVCKDKKQYTHWSSYIKVNVFDDLKQKWTTEHFKMFQKSPFCHFLNMYFLKIQPQLLCSLLLAEIDNDRDVLFIFNINDKELHFEKRKFSVVSGLKYFKKSDFVSDPKVKNKLMDRYYPGMNKVMRSVFYDDFVNKKITFRVEDFYEIRLVYLISRFLQSELPRTFIKKADFDLIESGHYLKYDWGDIVFTNEEEVEFNLGAIHQDSLGHEHRNDLDHSVPSISEDTFTVLKNEIVNVRCDMSLFQEKVLDEMIEYQKKVDSEFNGMREFVQESVNDCGIFVRTFTQYVSHGMFDIFSRLFDAVNYRIRYGALLWDYVRRKQTDGAISESEATENVTSKHGGFKRSREQFESTRTRYYQSQNITTIVVLI
ncbi:hypothetical protein FXO38_27711 [Capsicum annuum]|nr:hypothetical protein FXO38_27711 [Capsicum annuum]KAF3629755.1 hypothetical protein FXO37_28778 [Capsicum annuum]